MVRKLRTASAPAALFSGALLAGWIGHRAIPGRDAPPFSAAAEPGLPVAEPFVQHPDEMDVRIWLAGALVDANAERLKQIASSLAGITDLNDKAWHVLFSCWFEKEPLAAWRFVMDRPHLRLIALEEWAALDPGAARAAADSPFRSDWPGLIRGAVRKDVVTAFRLLEEGLGAGLEIDSEDSSPLDQLGLKPRHFAELARSDPPSALAWAERLKSSAMLGAVLSGWHEAAPAAALSWLEQRPDGDKILFDLANVMEDSGFPYRPALTDFLSAALPAGYDRLEALQGVLESLSWVDPDLAAREAGRIFPDPELRAEAIGQIAGVVARTDFAKAWEMLDQLDPSVLEIRRVTLPAIELSDDTGTRSVNLFSSYAWNLTSMRRLAAPADIRSDLLWDLIEVDKEAALRTMEKIPAADFQRLADPAFQVWQARDPEEAVRWLAAKLGAHGRLDHAQDLVLHDRQDPAALRDLIEELPDGPVRSALALQAAAEPADMQAAVELADRDPLAALRFARDSSAVPEVVDEVYGKWAENDARSAFEHLAADPEAPPSAWARIAEAAMEKAPEEFARAVMGLTNDTARDAAVAKIVGFMSHSDDPLAAPHWALAIRSGSERQAAMEQVFDRLGADLRLARQEGTAQSLRDLIWTSEGIPATEKTRWLERIDLEFASP